MTEATVCKEPFGVYIAILLKKWICWRGFGAFVVISECLVPFRVFLADSLVEKAVEFAETEEVV